MRIEVLSHGNEKVLSKNMERKGERDDVGVRQSQPEILGRERSLVAERRGGEIVRAVRLRG